MSVHNSNNNNNNNPNNKKWSLIRFLIVAAIFLIGLAVTGNLKSFLPFLDWGEDENTSSYTQQIDDIEDIQPDIDIAPEHTETPEQPDEPDEPESIPTEQTTANTTTTATTTEQTTTTAATTTAPVEQPVEISYYFRNQSTYDSHYEKHKDEFGDITQEEYLQMANELIASTADTVLTKYEDDGDFMYFDTATGYFLVLSPDDYIRTFFVPTDGIDYWNRQ